jgi:hypothetical protein
MFPCGLALPACWAVTLAQHATVCRGWGSRELRGRRGRSGHCGCSAVAFGGRRGTRHTGKAHVCRFFREATTVVRWPRHDPVRGSKTATCWTFSAGWSTRIVPLGRARDAVRSRPRAHHRRLWRARWTMWLAAARTRPRGSSTRSGGETGGVLLGVRGSRCGGRTRAAVRSGRRGCSRAGRRHRTDRCRRSRTGIRTDW